MLSLLQRRWQLVPWEIWTAGGAWRQGELEVQEHHSCILLVTPFSTKMEDMKMV